MSSRRDPPTEPTGTSERLTSDAERATDEDQASADASELPDQLDTPIEVPETDLLDQRLTVSLDDDERSE